MSKKKAPEFVYRIDGESISRYPIKSVSAGRWYLQKNIEEQIGWSSSYRLVHNYILAKDGSVFVRSKRRDDIKYVWGPEFDKKWEQREQRAETAALLRRMADAVQKHPFSDKVIDAVVNLHTTLGGLGVEL